MSARPSIRLCLRWSLTLTVYVCVSFDVRTRHWAARTDLWRIQLVVTGWRRSTLFPQRLLQVRALPQSHCKYDVLFICLLIFLLIFAHSTWHQKYCIFYRRYHQEHAPSWSVVVSTVRFHRSRSWARCHADTKPMLSGRKVLFSRMKPSSSWSTGRSFPVAWQSRNNGWMSTCMIHSAVGPRDMTKQT